MTSKNSGYGEMILAIIRFHQKQVIDYMEYLCCQKRKHFGDFWLSGIWTFFIEADTNNLVHGSTLLKKVFVVISLWSPDIHEKLTSLTYILFDFSTFIIFPFEYEAFDPAHIALNL